MKILNLQIKNFITCVEVKLSSADDVRFNDANNLEVYYKHQDYWSNVTMQSRNQLFATREAIQKRKLSPKYPKHNIFTQYKERAI